jgi:hypothetical protein
MKVKTGRGAFYSRQAISRAVRVNPDRNLHLRRKKGPLVDGEVPDQLGWYRHMHLMNAIGVRLKSPIEYARHTLAELNIPK